MEIDLARQSLAIPVGKAHDIGNARRRAQHIVKDRGFDEVAIGRVGIVATELAGNLVKHAEGGTLILRLLEASGAIGVEIISLDRGPGMDVHRCMADGYSTAGSPGTGLGAIDRMSNSFEIYSLRDRGTTMVARLWPGSEPTQLYDLAAICLPIAGETLCGDGWAAKVSSDCIELVVSDGLGHGAIAARATDAALETFKHRNDMAPGAMLELMHGALKSTRGAAVLSVKLDIERNIVTCAGIGNIAGYILTGAKPRGMVSMNGIVGHQIAKVKEFTYDCDLDDMIILHSDGLTTHWKFDDYPGLLTRPASLIAAVMYKAFRREKDDATVLVLRRR